MKTANFLKLFGAILLCELAGLVGSGFTFSAIPQWYSGLIKPALAPPSWVFGPVWTTLYALMGVALWLVWSSYAKATDGQAKQRIKYALTLFMVQLILNAIWSPIFFGLHSIGDALAVIVLLWAAIVLTIKIFTKVSKPAAWLLVPYILWVSFAVYLNFALWKLN